MTEMNTMKKNEEQVQGNSLRRLYGESLVQIPTPHFIVFYNGAKEVPVRMELKLSDAFAVKEEDVALELKIIMLNINRGYNEELKKACKTLGDYSEYTNRVRSYAKTMKIEDAVERAITECIQEGILAEFLSKNRAEAKSVSIYEYDMEKHMKQEREEAFEAGEASGIRKSQVKMIQKLNEIGFSNEEIAKIVEMDIEEVKELL